ncbi:hypothetical protein [Paenibacillus pectinilyticus]|uniref:hypothetical protein n=1 Tax=Paenibacillus pectinilyticus TaxID=512399 RepID=UPI00114D0B2B|nr:hypothetical protein [Paenibacillus pectinilyticus]
MTSTSNGLATAANNAANTISNGNNFTVGNSTLINFSDNAVALAALLLLSKCICPSPGTGTGTTMATGCGGNIAISNLEGLITGLIDDERARKKELIDVLRQNNSIIG